MFKVLKSTRRTPLGIFKDFITSAVRNRLYYSLIYPKLKKVEGTKCSHHLENLSRSHSSAKNCYLVASKKHLPALDLMAYMSIYKWTHIYKRSYQLMQHFKIAAQEK